MKRSFLLFLLPVRWAVYLVLNLGPPRYLLVSRGLVGLLLRVGDWLPKVLFLVLLLTFSLRMLRTVICLRQSRGLYLMIIVSHLFLVWPRINMVTPSWIASIASVKVLSWTQYLMVLLMPLLLVIRLLGMLSKVVLLRMKLLLRDCGLLLRNQKLTSRCQLKNPAMKPTTLSRSATKKSTNWMMRRLF